MYQQVENIIFGKRYQNLCRCQYHNHHKGCPNYGKREDCPPCDLVDEVLDLRKPLYVIYTPFEVGKFAERMRQNHPEWSDQPRQWYNCIRWQGTARKMHKEDIAKFKEEHPEYIVMDNPEALGVDVTEMMKLVGIELEWNYHEKHDPERITYRVSIAGIKQKCYA